MTQAEWNSCTDPEAMLNALCTSMSGKALDQQLRLIACGCVRRVWDELVDARGRRAIEVAERYAQGKETLKELDKAYLAACDAAEERGAVIDQMDSTLVTLAVLESGSHLEAAAMTAAEDIRHGVFVACRILAGTLFSQGPDLSPETRAELARQAQLIREIVGGYPLQTGR